MPLSLSLTLSRWERGTAHGVSVQADGRAFPAVTRFLLAGDGGLCHFPRVRPLLLLAFAMAIASAVFGKQDSKGWTLDPQTGASLPPQTIYYNPLSDRWHWTAGSTQTNVTTAGVTNVVRIGGHFAKTPVTAPPATQTVRTKRVLRMGLVLVVSWPEEPLSQSDSAGARAELRAPTVR